MAAPLFELAVYKDFSPHDGALITGEKEAVAAFVAMCCKYVDPSEVPQARTRLDAETLYMAYADMSGCHKPKMVMLMGPLTEEMKAEAQAALAAMYTQVDGCKVGPETGPEAPPTSHTLAAPVMFELQCYEHMDCYDGDTVTSDQAVAAFVAMCRRHVDPREVLQEDTRTDIGTQFMAYKDRSGNDKPKTVMLMGPLTEEMKAEAQAALAAMYTQECGLEDEDGGTCKIIVPLGSGVCKSCHEAMCAEE